MNVKEDESNIIDTLVQTGALRVTDEGNNPNYTSAVLRDYSGKPIIIYGCFYGDKVIKFELDRLDGVYCTEINEGKIKEESTRKIVNSIKNSSSHFPQILVVEGEIGGKPDYFVFSKVLGIESEGNIRNFLVDNKMAGFFRVYNGFDPS